MCTSSGPSANRSERAAAHRWASGRSWLIDSVGAKGAHTEIQAIKVGTPAMAEWVIDKAIQAHGAAGVSQDTPLAHMWAAARSLRFADGPDEVHKRSLARRELRRYLGQPAARQA